MYNISKATKTGQATVGVCFIAESYVLPKICLKFEYEGRLNVNISYVLMLLEYATDKLFLFDGPRLIEIW